MCRMAVGSIDPERVAPGRPASGVKLMLVSSDAPFLIQHAEAPDPKWRTIKLVVNAGFWRNSATLRRMKE